MTVDYTRPILAIDTATSVLSLALQHQNQIYTFHQEVGNRQSALILPEIHRLLTQAKLNISDLAAIVYAQGPGAFTGLRIGIGVAQGLATPFHTPLIGIPTLDAVASQCPDTPCVLAAIDARMGEVFYAWFNTQTHQKLSDYQVGTAQSITAPTPTCTHIQGIGNAFMLPEKPHFSGSPEMPQAQHYLRLAQSGRYPITTAAEAELLYVRNKIALTAKEQAERRKQNQA